MTDSSGNIQAQYIYDPFGRSTQLQASVVSDFQYAGYYFHSPSGLNITLHRQYGATLGRWISRDPIGLRGGSNLYAYVRNNPVAFNNPSGLAASFIPPIKPPKRCPEGGEDEGEEGGASDKRAECSQWCQSLGLTPGTPPFDECMYWCLGGP